MDKMKKLTKKEVMQEVRMGVVAILGCLCFVCLSGEPANEETWWSVFFISKAIAFAFGLACYSLFKYWNKRGLLPEIEDE